MHDADKSQLEDVDKSVQQAKASVAEIGDMVSQQARAAGEELREAGREKFQRGRDQVSERIAGVADAVDGAGDKLRQRGEPRMADWIDRGAEELQSFAELVRKQDIDSLVQRTRSLAERSPALFVGGSIITGMLLGRVLRSVSEER